MNTKWTQTEIDIILSMKKEGKTPGQISEILLNLDYNLLKDSYIIFID